MDADIFVDCIYRDEIENEILCKYLKQQNQKKHAPSGA